MQHPFRPGAGGKQAGLERVAGPRRAERPDAAIAPIVHMVNRAGKWLMSLRSVRVTVCAPY
ncbi:MAG: hypothetical protein Q7S40_25670, partial [Opitutaceae bacterium]|nr:hypothetical protein [Opitutaceae bacterium]